MSFKPCEPNHMQTLQAQGLARTVIYLSVTLVQLSGVSEALPPNKSFISGMFTCVSNMLRAAFLQPMVEVVQTGRSCLGESIWTCRRSQKRLPNCPPFLLLSLRKQSKPFESIAKWLESARMGRDPKVPFECGFGIDQIGAY